MTNHDENKEVVESVVKLYARCWNTAHECYQRLFPNKDLPDRENLMNMTQTMFQASMDLILANQSPKPE